ncbi:hypothetical protein ACP70R_002580 [Stipagrostis hirtigluma subsp. patula]
MEEDGRQWRRRRIPAFGEWNYRYHDSGDGGGDDDSHFSECFGAVMRDPHRLPGQKPVPNKRARAGGARRRRVPAFGEWNHRGGGGDDDDDGWLAAMTPFFDLAAAQEPPYGTARRDGNGVAAAAKQRTVEPHGWRGSKVADTGAYAARKSCFAVVNKAVDDDLYGAPPDMLYHRPARKGGWLRILLVRWFCPRGMAQ